jgi:hypothetical protein
MDMAQVVLRGGGGWFCDFRVLRSMGEYLNYMIMN